MELSSVSAGHGVYKSPTGPEYFYPPRDPEEVKDDAQSILTLPPVDCNMVKATFDGVVGSCVDFIRLTMVMPERSVSANQRDLVLMGYINNAAERGFFGSVIFIDRLTQILNGLYRVGNRDECILYILDGYHVGVFREAGSEFQKLVSKNKIGSRHINNFEQICRLIASRVVLRKLIEREYGSFTYFGSKDTLKGVNKDILFLKRTH